MPVAGWRVRPDVDGNTHPASASGTPQLSPSALSLQRSHYFSRAGDRSGVIRSADPGRYGIIA